MSYSNAYTYVGTYLPLHNHLLAWSTLRAVAMPIRSAEILSRMYLIVNAFDCIYGYNKTVHSALEETKVHKIHHSVVVKITRFSLQKPHETRIQTAKPINNKPTLEILRSVQRCGSCPALHARNRFILIWKATPTKRRARNYAFYYVWN